MSPWRKKLHWKSCCPVSYTHLAMNMGCEALKFFPAEANGGVGMLKNIGAALKLSLIHISAIR